MPNKNNNTGIRLIKIKKNNKKEFSTLIPHCNKIKKNNKQEKNHKLQLDDNSIKTNPNNNLSYNLKKPKTIKTDNNIYYDMGEKKERYKEKINYKKNNKNTSYKKINNENANKNKNNLRLNKIKDDDIRSKTNEASNNNISKESKSNISHYEKRKNYNVPKVRIKRTKENTPKKKEEKKIDENEREIEKEKYILNLLESKQNSYIREFQKMVQDTTASKESKEYENKKKVIADYGIDIQSLENLDGDNDEEIPDENKNIN